MRIRQQFANQSEGGEPEFEENLGVGYKEKTVFGGFLALVAWSILIAEFGLTMNKIFWQRDNIYTLNDIFLTLEEMETEFSLGDFDSGHFFFGIDVQDLEVSGFDLLNNPYVEFFGYNWRMSVGVLRQIEIDICTPE